MQKWAGIFMETGKTFANLSVMTKQMREDSDDLVLANTIGHHKTSRRWNWHSPKGQHHNQSDYILVRKRSPSEMNIAITRSFPGADIGGEHDLLMMTLHLCLKRISKPKHTRHKFELEKLKDPKVLETF